MGTLSKILFTGIEIGNELFTAIGAGFLGLIVLLNHGIKTNQMLRTTCVAVITIGSFVYASQQETKLKPTRRKVVLITGCDTGIGFSLCQYIADLGFTVIAGFLSLNSAGAKIIQKEYGDRILQLEIDITDAKNIAYAVESVAEYLEQNPKCSLYAIINNAGIMVFGEFEWQTENLIRRQLEVNIHGTFNLTRAFCPLIRKYKGRIITVTSHCALATLPGLAVYGATKAALAAWSDGIRVELAKYGIKVITFIPGSFPTESNIMSNQLQHVKEMHDAFSQEQHAFYSDYFKRYNIYLSYLAPPSSPQRIFCPDMYKTFSGCLLDLNPYSVYKYEPIRYTFYHFLFKFSPTVQIRDYFITKFMKMPEYYPEKSIENEVL